MLSVGIKCPCGEMDITTVFGTVIAGSSPAGDTSERSEIVSSEKANCLAFVRIRKAERCVSLSDRREGKANTASQGREIFSSEKIFLTESCRRHKRILSKKTLK